MRRIVRFESRLGYTNAMNQVSGKNDEHISPPRHSLNARALAVLAITIIGSISALGLVFLTAQDRGGFSGLLGTALVLMGWIFLTVLVVSLGAFIVLVVNWFRERE